MTEEKDKKSRKGYKLYADYHPKMLELVTEKYGTVDAFAKDNGITHPTAYAYMKNPNQAFWRKGPEFYKSMFEKLGVSLCDAMATFGISSGS